MTTGLRIRLGLAVDTAGDRLYGTDNRHRQDPAANLDGTEVEDLVTSGLDLPRWRAVDADGGKAPGGQGPAETSYSSRSDLDVKW